MGWIKPKPNFRNLQRKGRPTFALLQRTKRESPYTSKRKRFLKNQWLHPERISGSRAPEPPISIRTRNESQKNKQKNKKNQKQKKGLYNKVRPQRRKGTESREEEKRRINISKRLKLTDIVSDNKYGPKFVENKVHIHTYSKRIFTFTEEVTKKSNFVIPFEAKIPEDLPVSYSHSLKINHGIRLEENREDIIGGDGAEKAKPFKIKIASIIESNDGNTESVEITHTLSVYFVSEKAIHE